MEPRPSRSRSPQPSDRSSGQAAGGRAGGAPDLYAPYAVGSGPVPPLPPGAAQGGDVPLVSRNERRRRGIARVAGGVLLLLLLVGAGFWFRDRLPTIAFGTRDQGGLPALQATPPPADLALETAPGTPAAPAPTRAPLVASVLATTTPTPPSARPAADGDDGADAGTRQEPAEAVAPEEAAPEEAPVEAVPLVELLPTEDAVPQGLVATEPNERSRSEVVAALGGTEEAAQLLDAWGWEGNAYVDFAASSELPPGSTSFINVSVHRFADAEAADNALIYFSDYVVATQGLADIEVEPVGDAVRALAGAPEGAPLVVLYVRDGATMYRIGGSANSPDGDPTADVVAVAQAVVGG